ncbi:amidase signature domain-containing protein [Aspergillus undulatus]|uniref:amidase signature domain-containing protein n=1 Tax=Aspergillus undulatus TaxID=1810928 RepID=UPI003CCD0560
MDPETPPRRCRKSEVAVAFCKRAAVAQQVTHCLMEIMFNDAIVLGRELDEYLRVHGRTMGLLPGVPVSIKDSFDTTGHETTMGCISFIECSMATGNSPIADILLCLGAVLYVKTNIPQTMISTDSENNIFGRVLNPHNLSLTAGGSSGGEGTLLAMRGSILGVGTDIAGSIRVPVLCCGTFGFKLSCSRIPHGGQSTGPQPSASRREKPGIQPCAGPLAMSLGDLELFMGVGAQDGEETERTAVGVVLEDPEYPFQPPISCTLKAAVEHSPSKSKAAKLSFKLFSLDSSRTAFRQIEASGEPPIPRADFAAVWHKIWLENELDAIIMPGHNRTASPHDSYGHPPYTLLWNLLDYPACIIPYGKIDQLLIPPRTVRLLQRSYDPGIFSSAPCAIQVVGRKGCGRHCSL